MASIIKHGKFWRCFIYVNGIRRTRVFDTKREARAWADELEDKLKRGGKSFYQAIDKYLAEESPKNKSARGQKLRLERIKREIPNCDIKDLTPAILSEWRNKRLEKVKSSSVNRDISDLNAVFSVARREWEWLDKNPLEGVRKPENPPPRKRGITDKEIEIMLDSLGWDEGACERRMDEVAIAWQISIETAMRCNEVLTLTENQVDTVNRVAVLYDTKNGDMRKVPLTHRACELLGYVDLPFKVNPEVCSALFRKARIRTGIKDLTYHDSRSEGISRLSKHLDVLELARAIGHRDLKSLLIYYHTTAEDMAKKLP